MDAPLYSIADAPLEERTLRLLAYCQANDWAGYDPYDVLNSKVLEALPFLNFRLARIALTQTLKRSPINIRPFLRVPKKQNPKALALFLAAALKLQKAGVLKDDGLAGHFLQRLIALRSQNIAYWCWGYSFPWQMRTEIVPEGFPNLVCTVFVADALFDAYEELHDERCLSMAISAADYVATVLYWSESDSMAGFAYPLPSLRGQVHNANFLGAALLCRAARYRESSKFLDRAFAVARHSVAEQRPDGSWFYGEMPSQRWIDNFHTGYNLCALRAISRYSGTMEFDDSVRHGLKFYLDHFFQSDGSVTYFHDRVYPTDTHCVAQSIITLLNFSDINHDAGTQALSVLRWALAHLCDEQGFFYYQVQRSYTNRVPYMRWSQAWMLLAMVMLLDHCRCDRTHVDDDRFGVLARDAHD